MEDKLKETLRRKFTATKTYIREILNRSYERRTSQTQTEEMEGNDKDQSLNQCNRNKNNNTKNQRNK